jgi:hypothetical protein
MGESWPKDATFRAQAETSFWQDGERYRDRWECDGPTHLEAIRALAAKMQGKTEVGCGPWRWEFQAVR